MRVVFHGHDGRVLYTTPPILPRTGKPQPPLPPLPPPSCSTFKNKANCPAKRCTWSGSACGSAPPPPGPPGCHPDPGMGYTGANLFGDKHAVNSTDTVEKCCSLCQQLAAKGCAFYQFSPASCYGHPGGCCRLKTADAWKGRGASADTGGSIHPLPGRDSAEY